MTNREQIQIIEAYECGEEIEYMSNEPFRENRDWGTVIPSGFTCWDFSHYNYRIKKQPRFENINFKLSNGKKTDLRAFIGNMKVFLQRYAVEQVRDVLERDRLNVYIETCDQLHEKIDAY